MRTLTAVVVALALVAPGVAAGSTWQKDLDRVLAAPGGAEREELVREFIAGAPGWEEAAAHIESMTFPAFEGAGEPVLRTTVCIDTVERPWVLQVPRGYDPAEPTPLLMVLHGGVGTADVDDDPLGSVEEGEFAALALERGWIDVFPFGQAGATWWDEVGMANVRNLIRTVKRELNVDDDRVWMTGFSDGASAGFAHAMLAPDDYAAFVALNGHMGVASLDGDLPTYAPNMAATPMFATTTFDDWLYPSRKMRATIEMAREAGADIYYREFPGYHDFDDVAHELPAIARFVERHARDPFPTRIEWEAGDTDFGSCRWLKIDSIALGDAAPWHDDHNAALLDDRITIGFQPDYDFEGPGILVGILSDGDYPARSIGLKAGDVIVRAGEVLTDSLANLNEWKEGVERGDPIEMAVLREGEEVVLRGTLPEAAGHFIFKRDVPSALVRADFAANKLVVETSRVGRFRVRVHPDMVFLEQPLVIAVNGEVVHDAVVEPDVAYMLSSFLEHRDRRLLYVAEIEVEVE